MLNYNLKMRSFLIELLKSLNPKQISRDPPCGIRISFPPQTFALTGVT